MAYGVAHLVTAAKKAVHAMRRRCAAMSITDPALQCKLFNSQVMPILSYASEVWAVDPNIGAGAELLHRQFLKQLLRVRNSTSNQIVLAEIGRYPLQFHYWQQILRFHNRALRMPNDNPRLVRLALLEGAVLQDHGQVSEASTAKNWRRSLDAFLSTQPGHPRSFTNLDVSTIVDGLKEGYQSALYADDEHSSLVMYRSLQPEYMYAPYLYRAFAIGS